MQPQMQPSRQPAEARGTTASKWAGGTAAGSDQHLPAAKLKKQACPCEGNMSACHIHRYWSVRVREELWSPEEQLFSPSSSLPVHPLPDHMTESLESSSIQIIWPGGEACSYSCFCTRRLLSSCSLREKQQMVAASWVRAAAQQGLAGAGPGEAMGEVAWRMWPQVGFCGGDKTAQQVRNHVKISEGRPWFLSCSTMPRPWLACTVMISVATNPAAEGI